MGISIKRLFIRWYSAFLYRKHAHEIKTCCIFIGYPRSAHTLTKELLSAHPEILIAHEHNAVGRFADYREARELFQDLLANYYGSAGDPHTSQKKSRYNYVVPNQFQGKIKKLTVIGDKRGGKTSDVLSADFSQLSKFMAFVGVPVKIIHVVRNPYDNISSYQGLFNLSNEQTIDLFAQRYYPTTQKVLQHYPDQVLTIHAEKMIAEPRHYLEKMIPFLGLTASEQYYEDCTSIVWDVPHQSRFNPNIHWSPEAIQRVQDEMINRYDFLRHYTFNLDAI